MTKINKATLTEADIISKYLRPAIKAAYWDENRQGVKPIDGQMAVCKKIKQVDSQLMRWLENKQIQFRLTDAVVDKIYLTDKH